MCSSGSNLSNGSCEWIPGESIPIIKPKSCCTKIKARHLTSAAKKYLSINDLRKLLDKDKRVVAVRNIDSPTSKEAELLSLTHRVIVVEKSEGVFVECIAPVDEAGMFVRHTTGIDRTSSSIFHRSVADYNGFVLLSFSYEMGTTETEVNFNMTYIDFYSLQIIKHKESITNLTKSKFKFHLMLNCGLFCLVWPYHKCFSVLDFTKTTLQLKQYPIDEDFDEFYVVELIGGYLSVTMNNKSFHDDVFFHSDGSERDTVYYSLESGSKYSSQVAMKKMSKLMKIENPVDVVFLSVPNKPMWMVTECLPTNMTLSSITFFSEVELDDDAATGVKKRLDLSHLVSTKEDFFEKPNEHQINFEVCKIQWHVFLWMSTRHILQIDLIRLQPSAILELETNNFYNDYKNELYNFTIKMSLDRQDINVFIRDSKSIVHFECFRSSAPIKLQQLAKFKVISCYPKSIIDKLSLKSDLREEILASY